MPRRHPPQSKPAYPRSDTLSALRSRKRGRHKDREPTHAPLDSTAFPHVLARIVDLAPPASLLALRGASRALREHVDARLAEHPVLRPPLATLSHGTYIYACAPGPSGDPLALPGFAFFPGNALRPYPSVRERERRPPKKAPSLAAAMLLDRKAQKEWAARAAYTPRAGEWCAAALAHTRTLALPAFSDGVERLLRDMGGSMAGLRVVRAAPGTRLHTLPLPAPHLLTSVDTWGERSVVLPTPAAAMRSMTVLFNVPARGRDTTARVLPDPGTLRALQHITVVFRPASTAAAAAGAAATPPPGWNGSPALLETMADFLQPRTRLTIVNVGEETQGALGLRLTAEEGADGGYEAAAITALESTMAHVFSYGYAERIEEMRADLRANTRALGLEEWLGEADEADVQAYHDYW